MHLTVKLLRPQAASVDCKHGPSFLPSFLSSFPPFLLASFPPSLLTSLPPFCLPSFPPFLLYGHLFFFDASPLWWNVSDINCPRLYGPTSVRHLMGLCWTSSIHCEPTVSPHHLAQVLRGPWRRRGPKNKEQ